MPIGMEVGFGSGDIVLDGDPAPPRKGTKQPLTFGPPCSGMVAHLIGKNPLVKYLRILLKPDALTFSGHGV